MKEESDKRSSSKPSSGKEGDSLSISTSMTYKPFIEDPGSHPSTSMTDVDASSKSESSTPLKGVAESPSLIEPSLSSLSGAATIARSTSRRLRRFSKGKEKAEEGDGGIKGGRSNSNEKLY